MTTIKRQDAMTALKEVMKTLNLELSVSDAEYMVVIEVNPILCGFSVLRDYEGSLHECHLQKASENFENQGGDDDDDDDESDDEDADESDPPKDEGCWDPENLVKLEE
eukprot:symbB.v1.2.031920.t1/scaffold3673.1/size52203/3